MTKPVPNRGFSLTELMVVMSLVTIASGFAFSTLLPYNDQFRVKGAAFQLATELQRARMEAVRTRLCHFFDRTSAVEYRIVRDDPATRNCVLDGADTTLRTLSLVGQYPGVTMNEGSAEVDPFGADVAGPAPTSMRFEPRGIVTTAGGSTIFVKSNDFGPMAVTVTAAGSVRTWRQDSGGWK